MLGVCLDNLRSAYNVGSVFRSADTFAIHKIYLCGLTPTPLNPKLQKTALGSINTVSWEHHCDTVSCLKYLKHQSFSLIALETGTTSTSILDFSFPGNSCLVLGNEVMGISPKALKLCQEVVSIPQLGTKESLNVASAAAIALYEYRRQHPKI